MHISLPVTPPPALWEGDLEAPAEVKSFAPGTAARASIAPPAQWADGLLMGETWLPPIGGSRFHVVRLAFTVRPRGNTVVEDAAFCLRLHPQGALRPTAFDAFPRTETVERKDNVTFGVGPSFKIGTAETL